MFSWAWRWREDKVACIEDPLSAGTGAQHLVSADQDYHCKRCSVSPGCGE